jgi:hypothetical protein
MTTMKETYPMNRPDSPALRTALAYYHAWTSHDLDKAMSHIADDIVCDAPTGRLEGAAAYRGFMGPFVQVLTGQAGDPRRDPRPWWPGATGPAGPGSRHAACPPLRPVRRRPRFPGTTSRTSGALESPHIG